MHEVQRFSHTQGHCYANPPPPFSTAMCPITTGAPQSAHKEAVPPPTVNKEQNPSLLQLLLHLLPSLPAQIHKHSPQCLRFLLNSIQEGFGPHHSVADTYTPMRQKEIKSSTDSRWSSVSVTHPPGLKPQTRVHTGVPPDHELHIQALSSAHGFHTTDR